MTIWTDKAREAVLTAARSEEDLEVLAELTLFRVNRENEYEGESWVQIPGGVLVPLKVKRTGGRFYIALPEETHYGDLSL